ncbi:MAG: hypothetical protein DID92_2727744095 [Candidatus Nitrotoga sp. SPKER]|nr:MAG: hypothetical protein DID92_2727744095 [Candidatus Nitrotoga sp. SPKER]
MLAVFGRGDGLVFTQDHWLGDESHDDASGLSLSGVADGDWTAASNGRTDIAFRSREPVRQLRIPGLAETRWHHLQHESHR